MGLTFWDTVRGVHLAETLTRQLPELNKNLSAIFLQKKEQKIEVMHFDRVYEYLCSEQESGRRLVSCIQNGSDVFVIITE